MKKVTLKALVALAALAGMTSAFAVPVPVFLNEVGLRAASGTYYKLFINGEDGNPASTATWTWDATTGILTQTSGFLQANQRLSNSPVGASLLSDHVTGLTIDTMAGTTDASTYMCIEGTFGAGTGSHQCGNFSFGFNAINESSVAYNVNAEGECEERTIGGDDAAGGGNVFRGLRSWDGTLTATCGGATVDGNNTGRGAMDMSVLYQDIAAPAGLILYNRNAGATSSVAACMNPGSLPGEAPCQRQHWMTFSYAVPVPAAVWLFGSALGLLGWVRRRAMA
jgi:hypothetical protein